MDFVKMYTMAPETIALMTIALTGISAYLGWLGANIYQLNGKQNKIGEALNGINELLRMTREENRKIREDLDELMYEHAAISGKKKHGTKSPE